MNISSRHRHSSTGPAPQFTNQKILPIGSSTRTHLQGPVRLNCMASRPVLVSTLLCCALGESCKLSKIIGTWAPTLSLVNGKFYMASMTRWTYDPVARVWPRVMWVSSRDLKTWSDPIWGDAWGIDPSLFQDPATQRVYLNLMAPNNNVDRIWGIYQCEVDVNSGRCIGEYHSLWNGTLPHNSSARPEGPKMFKRDHWYYLLIAEGRCDSR